MQRVGVIGAAGFAGIECVRILLGHPGFEVVYVSSDSEASQRVDRVYPALCGLTDLVYEALDVEKICERCDVVFLAVPHTASLAITPTLLDAGLTVIDLSADYRLKDPAVFEKWYGCAHTSPELLSQVVYGLPEFDRDELEFLAFSTSKLVACAGCYPTASTLGAMPALKAGIVTSNRVISDCLSGVSGAGRKLARSSSFSSAGENVCAYGVASHRHTPEISQTFSTIAGHKVDVVFTPHLVPIVRGLLATVYLDVDPSLKEDDIRGIYETAYAAEPFVTVLPAGSMPQTHDVSGSNNAQLGLALDATSHTLIVSCALDNLVKGAAGQAIQCANIILGLEETEGLRRLYPEAV